MNKIIKRIVSAVIALAVLLTVVVFDVPAMIASAAASGEGWSLDDNGKLTIANDTGMTNWGSVRSTYKDQVKSVEIKNEVTSIINKAFYGCGELSSITIPNSVNSIGGSAFAECKVLSSITIPNRVTSIGNYAFSDCKVLSSITIPASVKTLGVDIIQSSTNIKTITFEGEPPELSGFISSILGSNLASLTAIYVPCTLVEAYKNGEVIASNLRGKIQPKHNPAQVAAKAATCAAEGNVAHWHCSKCNKNFTDNTCATEITDVVIPKTDTHTWNAGKVTTPATCTATGIKTFSCTVCGQTKTENIPKTGHNTNGTVAHKDATCTATGVEGGTYCTVCNNGKADAEKTIPMLPHDWDGYQHDQDEHWQPCKNCDAENNREGHNWDGGTTVTEATEYAEGEMLYTCTVCAQTKTEPITKLPHTHKWSDEWTHNDYYHWHECTEADLHESEVHGEEFAHDWKLSEVLKETTCTETGMGKYVCDVCGAEKTEELAIDADAHDWESWTILLSPTLKTEGTAQRVCTRNSDHTETVDLPVLTDKTVWTKVSGGREDPTLKDKGSEDYTSEYGTVTLPIPELTDPVWGTPTRTDPTKEAEGKDEYTSTDYGTVTVTIPKLTDPVWGTPTRTDPTKEAEGKDEYHSDIYGDVTVVIPELSNTDVWTTDDSQHVEPTEEETGKDVYKSTDYGEVEVVLPKKEHTHTWGDWSITANPTLTATGTAKRVCTKNAEHTEIKTLPILTDTSVWTKVDGKHVDPTEDNDGKDVYTSEYGEVIVVLPALGHTHNWGDWSITVNPTLTETGTAQRVCTLNSTHIDTKTLPVLTDTSVWTKDDTQHVDPTVDNDGKDVYTSEYGEVIVVLPALGHTHIWGDWSITVNPTLTETGTAQRVCTLNNTHIDTKTLPVLTDTSVWTKDDTQHVDPTEDNDGKDVYTSEYGEVVYPLDKLPHTHKFPLTFVPEVKPTEDKEGVKEHWHCDGCGKDFEDEDGTKEVTADDLKIGKIETVVQAPANVPTPEIATPKEELVEATLTEEEQKKVDEGATIKIILKVEDATNTVQSEDKTAVADKLGELTNYKLGQYLDVTLLKKIGEQQEQKIANTSKPILITFEIPESLRGKSEYLVIRVHGSEATILRDLDSDPNTVTIETDKFSTYALTYKEKTSGGGSHRPTNPDTSDTSDDTSSDTSDNTSSDTSESTSDDTSDNTSSDTSESTSDDTSDNTPSDTSESTSGDTSDSTSSDTSDNTSSSIADSSASDNSSSGESSHIPSESDTSSGDNPATGIAVSLIPLTVAVAVVIAAAKRRHK